MKLLVLFAGSRSIEKEAEKFGYETYSSDIHPYPNIDYVADILNFDVNQVPFVPDALWASIPCTTYSVASIGCHWDKGYVPKTEAAKIGLLIAEKTLEIINYFLEKNPNMKFFIENPRGLLRKMPFMRNIPRHTVTYCQYGDTRMKPTDIWTNCATWKPRPMCRKGDGCHEAAPRGSKSGTQGISGAYHRSIVPPRLCEEILAALMDNETAVRVALERLVKAIDDTQENWGKPINLLINSGCMPEARAALARYTTTKGEQLCLIS